jgi:hypothetical protein
MVAVAIVVVAAAGLILVGASTIHEGASVTGDGVSVHSDTEEEVGEEGVEDSTPDFVALGVVLFLLPLASRLLCALYEALRPSTIYGFVRLAVLFLPKCGL